MSEQRVERALREGELKYRTLFETASDAILLMREDRFVDCNARALALFGCARDEIIGAPPYRFSPPSQPGGQESKALALEKIGQARSQGPQRFEWTHCRRDGTPFDAEVSLNAVELGGELLLQAIVHDVTERQRMEEALRAREREYRELVMLANSIIMRWSRDGRVTFLNEFGQRFFGYTEAEILGRHVVGTIVPENESTGRDLRLRMDWITADPQKFERGINENMRRGGERVWIDWTNKVVFDEQGQIREILSIGSDITERRHAEEQVRALNEELRLHAEVLEQRVAERTAELKALNAELEAFTYSVSHDLRAPLRQADGFAKILLDDYASTLDPTARHYLDRVREGTRFMGRLIDELLDFSRLGHRELTLQRVGLTDVVQEARHDLAPSTEGRRVEWKVGPLPVVECDPGLMRQVFVNLLSNAIKFTRPRDPALIEVGEVEREGQPAVFVRDNGVGFSMKYAHKLFGVFQRLHRQEDFEGTGVGLATVQRIVQKHGGRVWAEGELDHGATFYFTIRKAQVAA